jgi:cyclic pyranopterin phosphate synthase
MPENGIDWTPPDKILHTDEIIRLAGLFVSLGVDKIRLTGGEPLIRKDILDIVAALSPLKGLKVLAMTTNGIGLDKQAKILRQNGLTTLTISVDSLRADRFLSITKRDRLADVMAGINAALDAGFAPLKINIVVMKDINDDEILDFVSWGKDLPVDLRFIEYMPFPDNHWSSGGLLPYADMRAEIETQHQLLPRVSHASAVGKEFALAGHQAQISFVTSMTESFCSTCNRLRLTADGNIKSCLFHPAEKSLRDIIRDGGSDAELIRVISGAVQAKPAAHPPVQELMHMDNRAMIAIGG